MYFSSFQELTEYLLLALIPGAIGAILGLVYLRIGKFSFNAVILAPVIANLLMCFALFALIFFSLFISRTMDEKEAFAAAFILGMAVVFYGTIPAILGNVLSQFICSIITRRFRPQFSLQTLFVVVTFIAFACAALINANYVWAAWMATGTLVVLLGSLIGVLVSEGHRRAFWTGFAFFGWGYAMLLLGPKSLAYNPLVLNTTLLPVQVLTMISNQAQASVPTTSSLFFFIVAAPLCTLLFAYLGGLLARYFYSKRIRES